MPERILTFKVDWGQFDPGKKEKYFHHRHRTANADYFNERSGSDWRYGVGSRARGLQ